MTLAMQDIRLAHAWWWSKDWKYRTAWFAAPQAGALLVGIWVYYPFIASPSNQVPWASSDQAITDCDRLAASPTDFDRPAGVAGIARLKDIDADAAITTCEAEVKRAPSNRRFWTNLGRAYRAKNNDAAAAEAYKKGAELGSAASTYGYGALLSKSTSLPRDLPQARILIKRAAESGVVPAMADFAYLLVDGSGGPTDYESAARWFKKAGDFAPAQLGLGKLYESGRGVPQSFPDALRLYQQAAEHGLPQAYVSLARLYETGSGTPVDLGAAFKWYLKAAERGNLDSQLKVAIFYFQGRGIALDRPLAAKWFRAAAEQGAAGAQSILGRLYLEGQGVQQDDVEGAKWLVRAAEQHDADAEALVGYLYEAGKGVQQSYPEAIKWYKSGSLDGAPSADFGLALFYQNGRGLPVNYIEAARWYQRAADRGFERAQLNLAVMYIGGQGVAKDLGQAYKLLTLAVRSSDASVQDSALKLKRELAQSMAPDLIASAERSAAAWGPTDPGPPPELITQSASAPSQAPTGPVPRPSFDCSLARLAVEQLICADRDLASADAELGVAYQKRLASIAAPRQNFLAKEESDWVTWRNAQCNVPVSTTENTSNSKLCLLNAIRARTQALSNDASEQLSGMRGIDLSIPVPVSGQVRYPAGQVALKAAPSPGSASIATLSNGARVRITQDSNQWYLVQVGNTQGYMHHSWVKVDQFETGPFDERLIQVKSFQDYANAESFVRSFSKPLDVYLASNGWFAVTLSGSFEKANADELLAALKAQDVVPPDSFITYGNTYVRKVCCRRSN